MIPQHNWKDIGCDPHNGKNWYECTNCGARDWISGYGNFSQLGPAECTPPNKLGTGAGQCDTYESDIKMLLKFVIEQQNTSIELNDACKRITYALANGLSDYSMFRKTT